MNKRVKYTIIGEVQGVGFRYRAYHAANLLGLTGWVRNEYDGSVTMEVQGEQHEIAALLEMIEKSPYIRIDNLSAEDLPVNYYENSFEIRG